MPTIDGALRATARRIPDAEALKFGQVELNYAQLDEAVEAAARALAGLGLAKGDRVALMSTNSDRFVIAFYASQRLGSILVPVNPSSAPPEIEYLLADSGAAVLLFDPALVATIDAMTDATVAAGLPASCNHVVGLGETGDHPDLFALAADTETPLGDIEIADDDDALILYTSGTTGKPKGALFDHHRIMWVGVNVIATCGMRVGDSLLHVAPLYHAAELCLMLMPGTLIGAKHVVLGSFDPSEVLDTMVSERITMFFGADDVPVSARRARPRRPRPVRLAHRAVRRRPDAGERRRTTGGRPPPRRVHAAVRPDRGRPGRHLQHGRPGGGTARRQRPPTDHADRGAHRRRRRQRRQTG